MPGYFLDPKTSTLTFSKWLSNEFNFLSKNKDESFFKAEGYKVEVNDIDTDDKDQLKLFDEDNLEADSLKLEGWEPI